MTKFSAKKFVKASKTDKLTRMNSFEKREFINLVFKKIPNITKEEFKSICNSPAKISEILWRLK
jgi:hypothetical protein